MSELLNRPTVPEGAGCGNLLNEAVRREITDLNLLYLARALDPAEGCDDRYGIPGCALSRLAAAPHEAWVRAAQSPVALFELALPAMEPDGTRPALAGTGPRVADSWGELDARREARRAFGLVALGVAWRLGQGSPLTSRLVFGLGAGNAARLLAFTPSELFALASWPDLIRPRWAGHTRYWQALALAATGPVHEPLEWLHRAGLCLTRHRPTGDCTPRRPSRAG